MGPINHLTDVLMLKPNMGDELILAFYHDELAGNITSHTAASMASRLDCDIDSITQAAAWAQDNGHLVTVFMLGTYRPPYFREVHLGMAALTPKGRVHAHRFVRIGEKPTDADCSVDVSCLRFTVYGMRL